MKFLTLLVVIMLLVQELPFTISNVEKGQSGNDQKRNVDSDASVLDTKTKEIRSNKAITYENKANLWKPVSDEEAKALVANKGILKNPAVSLVTVSGDLLKELKVNETISLTAAEKRKKIPRDLCEEEKVNSYTLLKPNGNLAYRIQGARCTKARNGRRQQCSFHSIAFGECVEKESTVILSVLNAKGGSFDKTIRFNSSCKCRKYK